MVSLPRRGQIVVERTEDSGGGLIATIQFNDLPDHPRCVIRRLGHLVAQCHYSVKDGWVIFPIDHGQIAKQPLVRANLLPFLKEFEETESRRMLAAVAAS
jgi:hypothetical protein